VPPEPQNARARSIDIRQIEDVLEDGMKPEQRAAKNDKWEECEPEEGWAE
jgi:post-segregation antitoxin (ccd killing protein)